MNSCILMAEIVQEPQLRYTPDQVALTEMLVQFAGLRAEDTPATLKVVGWGNLAQEIQQQYHQGDRVIIEGRLNMNTVERPEGFKEKRAELTVQRIHSLGDSVSMVSSAAPAVEQNVTANATQKRSPAATSNSEAFNSFESRTPNKVEDKANAVGVGTEYDQSDMPQRKTPQVPNYPVTTPEADVDDIPF